MLTGTRQKAVLVLGFLLLAMVIACGDTPEPTPVGFSTPAPTSNIEAIVAGRVQATVQVISTMDHSITTTTPSSTPAVSFQPSESTVRSTRIVVSDRSLWAGHPASNAVIGLSLPDGERVWQTMIGCEPTTLTHSYSRLFVTCFDTGELVILDVGSGEVLKRKWVGHGAFGVIESAGRLYISLAHEQSILVLDADTLEGITRAPTAHQPRGLALKENQLYVVHLIDASVSVFDSATLSVRGSISIGLQAGLAESVTLDPNKARAYVPHQRQHITNMARSFDNTIFPTVSVLDTERLRPIRREALALDSIDTPVGMPIAVVLSEDGTLLYVANAASDDISVIDLTQGIGVGHIPVGHHPRDLALSPDGDRLYTSNMVSDNVSVIDTDTLSVVNTFALAEDSRSTIIQQGERIFLTSRPDEIARDNWMACASCHFDGGSDGQIWLGTEGGARNTPILRGIVGTLPLHWSGDRPNVQSFQETLTRLMGGTGLSQSELDALAAYLNSLRPFTSSMREPDGSLPKAAIEGAVVFQRAGCTVCHALPGFTDRQMHDVGTGGPFHDHPSGRGQKVGETMGILFDTPSLRELWLTAPYLHDGRAATLRELLSTFNPTDRHGRPSDLSEDELPALEAFLLGLPLAEQERAALFAE